MEEAGELTAGRRLPTRAVAELAMADLRRSAATQWIILGGVTLQVVLVLLHGINKELLGDGTFLALDQDANLPAWIETALFVVAGLGCWLLAWVRPGVRMPFALLGGVSLLLSLEQMAQLHTRVEADLGGLATNAIEPSMAIGLVAIVAFAARGVPLLSKLLVWCSIVSIAVAQGSSMVDGSSTCPMPV